MEYRRRLFQHHAWTAILFCFCVLQGCGGASRQTMPAQSLVVQRSEYDASLGDVEDDLFRTVLANVKSRSKDGQQPSTRPTVNMLVISGGGDWGAFGAGVLKGWGTVPGELKRPQFDIVTGVSTGALIAPFAFLGDDASIEQVVQLYRNPKPDWATPRGTLYFLPGNTSLFELPGLERDLKKTLDCSMLQRIVTEGESGRRLIVNTTDVDFGDLHVWDIPNEAQLSLSKGKEEHVHNILMASSAIPGIFPPRMIGDRMFVDGAITGNILYGGRISGSRTLLARWAESYPDQPLPRVRYWVIFNNQFRFPPQVTQPRWLDVISRASIMATQTATVNAMRHLFAQAEIERIRLNAEIEVRVISVPADWIPPKPGTFNKEVMNALADLGEKMGADPSSWSTESP